MSRLVVQNRLKMAGIDVSFTVQPLILDYLCSIASCQPVSWIFVGRDDFAVRKFLSIDALDEPLLSEFSEVVLKRTVAKTSTLISEVAIECLPRECHSRVYKKFEHSPLPVLLRHVPAFTAIREIRTGLVRINYYWPTFSDIGHICSIPAKQLSVPAVSGVRYGLFGWRRGPLQNTLATPRWHTIRFDSGRSHDSRVSESARFSPENRRRGSLHLPRRHPGVWWSDMCHNSSLRLESRGPFSDVQTQQHDSSPDTRSRHCLVTDGEGASSTDRPSADPHGIDCGNAEVFRGP